MTIPTYGEDLFEQYLQSHSIRYVREPEFPGIPERVDFVVEHPACGKILLEVKDIESKPPAVGGLGFFDLYRPIRTHIDAGRKKFRNTADYTCALVLSAPPGSLVMLEDPIIIMGAMYGDLGLQTSVNTETGVADKRAYRLVCIPGKGKMIRRSGIQNTRIAALITVTNHRLWPHAMSKYLDTEDGRSRQERAADVMNPEAVGLPPFDAEMLGVTVWENAVATRKLPKDLFRGDMDAWWEVTSEGRQLPTFIGSLRRKLGVDRRALGQLGMPE
jgi:hypothetical protein